MGYATAASSIASIFQNQQISDAADAQANAIGKEANNKADIEADKTNANAAKLGASFLQSGIALDMGPGQLIQQVYATGQTNIDRIKQNATASITNISQAARSKMLSNSLSSLSSAGGSFGASGGAGDGLTTQAAYGLNDMGYGNTAYDMLDNMDNSNNSISNPLGRKSWWN